MRCFPNSKNIHQLFATFYETFRNLYEALRNILSEMFSDTFSDTFSQGIYHDTKTHRCGTLYFASSLAKR
jgi:hypothetical protein